MKRKAKRVEIRVDAHTLKQWRLWAKVAGMSLSEWIRKRCEW